MNAGTDGAVLFVDDEAHVLAALKRLLRKEAFRTFFAASAEEALDLLRREEIRLVVADERMPGVSGIELLQEVKRLYPRTVRVILSGYADVAAVVDAINKGEVYRFFSKPWNDDELKSSLRQCLEHWRILSQNRDLLETTDAQNRQLQQMNEQLEAMVAQRTASLELAQEMVQTLALPVVGIGLDERMVLVNEKVREMLSCLAERGPGLAIGEFFPPALVADVRRALAGETVPPVVHALCDGKPYRVLLAPLEQGGRRRGCTAAFVPLEEGA